MLRFFCFKYLLELLCERKISLSLVVMWFLSSAMRLGMYHFPLHGASTVRALIGTTPSKYDFFNFQFCHYIRNSVELLVSIYFSIVLFLLFFIILCDIVVTYIAQLQLQYNCPLFTTLKEHYIHLDGLIEGSTFVTLLLVIPIAFNKLYTYIKTFHHLALHYMKALLYFLNNWMLLGISYRILTPKMGEAQNCRSAQHHELMVEHTSAQLRTCLGATPLPLRSCSWSHLIHRPICCCQRQEVEVCNCTGMFLLMATAPSQDFLLSWTTLQVEMWSVNCNVSFSKLGFQRGTRNCATCLQSSMKTT